MCLPLVCVTYVRAPVFSLVKTQEPMIIDNLPFDKYELEGSPLTLYILARKQPKICWQVINSDSCDLVVMREKNLIKSNFFDRCTFREAPRAQSLATPLAT